MAVDILTYVSEQQLRDAVLGAAVRAACVLHGAAPIVLHSWANGTPTPLYDILSAIADALEAEVKEGKDAVQ